MTTEATNLDPEEIGRDQDSLPSGVRASALARIRTWDTRFRKPVLYPLSYEGTRAEGSERNPCGGTARLVPSSLRRTGRCPTKPDQQSVAPNRSHRGCGGHLGLALTG